MLCLGPISSIFDYVTYGTLLFVFGAWSNPRLFQTGWFVESLLTQTLIITSFAPQGSRFFRAVLAMR